MPLAETYSVVVTAVPATASFATPFSAGDNVGGKLALLPEATRPRQTGKIVSVTLSDKAKQDAAIDVVFFTADPTTSTLTDNAAIVVTAADLVNIAGMVKILATDYTDFSAASVACKGNLNIRFQIPQGQFLFAALVSRGTPTYASASDLKLSVGIEQDS